MIVDVGTCVRFNDCGLYWSNKKFDLNGRSVCPFFLQNWVQLETELRAGFFTQHATCFSYNCIKNTFLSSYRVLSCHASVIVYACFIHVLSWIYKRMTIKNFGPASQLEFYGEIGEAWQIDCSIPIYIRKHKSYRQQILSLSNNHAHIYANYKKKCSWLIFTSAVTCK